MLSEELLEASVLQELMSMPKDIDRAMQRLNEYFFYNHKLQDIYQAVKCIYNRGEHVSVLSVRDELNRTFDDNRAQPLLAELGTICARRQDAMPLWDMVLLLEEYSRRRRLVPVAAELRQLCFSLTREFYAGIDKVRHDIDKILDVGQMDDFVSLSTLMDEAWQHAQDNQNPATQHLGLLTGIEAIDNHGGLSEGLTIVGARPSHGKSAFALYQAMRAMKAGKRVGFFSLEMTNLQLTQRLLSMQSGLSSTAIARLKLSPPEMARLDAARQQLNLENAVNFRFDNRGLSNMDRLMQSIRALKRNEGLDMVVLDYIQLLDLDRKSRDDTTAQMLAHASHQLHDIGRDEGLYIFCLSQLNRTSTGIPQRSQLRDSGGIDEAADNVILLYNGAKDHLRYFPAPYDQYDTDNKLLLLLDKNRNGPTSWSILGFDASCMSFDMAPRADVLAGSLQGELHLPE